MSHPGTHRVLGQMSSEGFWLCTGKNSRASQRKAKMSLFRRYISVGRKWNLSASESGPRALGHRFLQAKSIPGLTSGRNILASLGTGEDFPGIGSLPTIWPFMAHLGTMQ